MTDPKHTITREELAALDIRAYEGHVCLVGPSELREAEREIRRETVVGFDTETRPAFRPGQSYLPSLVQVATANAVFLFQVQRGNYSGILRHLLECSAIVKAGIGVGFDILQLKKLFRFREKGVVDVGEAAQRNGITQSGVRNLAGLILGFRIPKGPRTSNWARDRLSHVQTRYAATDAWVVRELYLRFHQRGWMDASE